MKPQAVSTGAGKRNWIQAARQPHGQQGNKLPQAGEARTIQTSSNLHVSNTEDNCGCSKAPEHLFIFL